MSAGAIAAVAVDLAVAQAKAKSADIESLLARCMSIVMNPQANAADKRLAIDAAYDMGVAEGRVQGKQEMGEALTGVRVAERS